MSLWSHHEHDNIVTTTYLVQLFLFSLHFQHCSKYYTGRYGHNNIGYQMSCGT